MISVIVPVYNSEPYLKRCLNSLVKQTLKNIEIILVDDGSTDNSGKICDEYAKKYSNFIVIHQKNSGVVRARLVGINNSKGDYLGFVDSDDWIDLDMYSSLLDSVVKFNADIVICRVADGNNDIKSQRTFEINTNVKNGYYSKEKMEHELYPYLLQDKENKHKPGVTPYLGDKLFKRDLILKNLRFLNFNVHWGEDQLLTYPAILSASSLYISDKFFYHYENIGTSATNKYRQNFFESCMHFFKCLDLISEFYGSNAYGLKKQVQTTKIITCMQMVNNEIDYSNDNICKQYKKVKIILENKYIKIYLKTINLVLKGKQKYIFI